jgi:type III secretion protein Q
MKHSPITLRDVPAQQVVARNALFRRRAPANFSIAGQAIALELRPAENEGDLEGSLVLRFAIDRKPGWLQIQPTVIAALLKSLEPGLDHARLSPDNAALALECVLAAELGQFERSIRARIMLVSVSQEPPRETDGLPVPFAITLDEMDTSFCRLMLPDSHIALLAASIGKTQDTSEFSGSVTFPVSVAVAAADITLAGLKSLSAGDVVMVSDSCPEGKSVALVANHLVYRASQSSDEIRIDNSPRLVRGSTWEWSMQSSGSSNEANTDDLDQLPVHLTFELGRLEMPLSEIRNLGSGSILPLARPVEQAVDIVANGKRVGRGTLVKIGDSIGVEVTRMFDGG